MLVIKIKGGLGNQMFQYALYIALKERGKKAILDTSYIYKEMKGLGRSTIFDVFCLDHNYVVDNKIYNFLMRYFFSFFRNLTSFKKRIYREPSFGIYDENVWKLDNTFLDGQWQSEKYFSLYRKRILEAFTLKQSVDLNNELVKLILNKANCTVSIHIRLGDYTSEGNQRNFGNICTAMYYRKAINHIRSLCNNPLFIVFSNDITKAKEIIANENVIFADSTSERNGWIDMWMMSKCRHNIIANSTFSWWAAWLNTNENKIVVAPQKWFNIRNTPDICPKDWTLI